MSASDSFRSRCLAGNSGSNYSNPFVKLRPEQFGDSVEAVGSESGAVKFVGSVDLLVVADFYLVTATGSVVVAASDIVKGVNCILVLLRSHRIGERVQCLMLSRRNTVDMDCRCDSSSTACCSHRSYNWDHTSSRGSLSTR